MGEHTRARRLAVITMAVALVTVAAGLAFWLRPGRDTPEALRLRPEQVARLGVRMLFAGPFPDGQLERSFADARHVEQVLAALAPLGVAERMVMDRCLPVASTRPE